MKVQIYSPGNAACEVAVNSVRICVDAFYAAPPNPRLGPIPSGCNRADLILVTHSHWDHFDASSMAVAARRLGSLVGGPATVIRLMRNLLPESHLLQFEPRQGEPFSSVIKTEKSIEIRVSAFRTKHSSDHNSYLVETPGFRFFHDGDNEDTRTLDMDLISPLDVLFLAPWQGSGWPEFVEKISPRYWFLIHLTAEEIEEHEAGQFLPQLCATVPMPDRIVALRPGESFALEM